MQNSARHRSQKHTSETTPLVSSDDDQIRFLSAGHFEQVTFRSSPARLNDHVWFLFRQKSCYPFPQVALKTFLNLLRVNVQRERSLISQSACVIRRPVGVQNGNVQFPHFA